MSIAAGAGAIGAAAALATFGIGGAAAQDPPSAGPSDLATVWSKPLCDIDFTGTCLSGITSNSLSADGLDPRASIAVPEGLNPSVARAVQDLAVGQVMFLIPDKYDEGGWKLNEEKWGSGAGAPIGPLTRGLLAHRFLPLHGVVGTTTSPPSGPQVPGARWARVTDSVTATTLGGGSVNTMTTNRTVDFVDPAYVVEKVAQQLPGSVVGGGRTSSWTVDAVVGDIYVHYEYRSCNEGKSLCIEKSVEPMADAEREVDAAFNAVAGDFVNARMAALHTSDRREYERYYAGVATRSLDELDAKLASWKGEAPRCDWISKQLEPARIAIRAASLTGWTYGPPEIREPQGRVDAYAARCRFDQLPDPYVNVDDRWRAWRSDHLDDLIGGAGASAAESLARCGLPAVEGVRASEPGFYGVTADVLITLDGGSASGRYPLLLDGSGAPRVLMPCSALQTPRFLARHPEWKPWFEGGEGYDLTEMLVSEVEACASQVGASWSMVGVDAVDVDDDRVVTKCSAEIAGKPAKFDADLVWRAEGGGPEFKFSCPPWGAQVPAESASEPPPSSIPPSTTGSGSNDAAAAADAHAAPEATVVDWDSFARENGGLPNLDAWVSGKQLDTCVTVLPPGTTLYLNVEVQRAGGVAVVSGTGKPLDAGVLSCATELAHGETWPAVTKGSARIYGMVLHTK